ncbi:transposase [Streptomyces coeruleorubidus]|uniref:transposase n=1 Tax=Streptomyces coeruleorubidus TaxID=116188 RepID=UPI0037014038
MERLRGELAEFVADVSGSFPRREAVGKRANCQVAVTVHAATDTASCPLEWRLYLPREWTDEPDRCRGAGVPGDVVHQEKWRLALGLLDTLAERRLKAPERGLPHVLTLTMSWP